MVIVIRLQMLRKKNIDCSHIFRITSEELRHLILVLKTSSDEAFGLLRVFEIFINCSVIGDAIEHISQFSWNIITKNPANDIYSRIARQSNKAYVFPSTNYCIEDDIWAIQSLQNLTPYVRKK